MTRHLLSLTPLAPCRILDMGAGNGQSVQLLLEMGFDAVGIDLLGTSAEPKDLLCNDPVSVNKSFSSPNGSHRSVHVSQGDFLHCPFAAQSFDAILSECAFYVSGSPKAALQEAARLLKKGGTLLLADVSPLPLETQIQTLQEAGFAVKHLEDITPLWKEYYLSCIWDGTADELCRCHASDIPHEQESDFSFFKKKFSYYLTICERM